MLNKSIKDAEGFTYNIYGYKFLLIKMPLLRQRLGSNLRVSAVVRMLRENGYVILAKGGDGGASSWIIAVNPRNSEHLRFLKVWCESMRIIEDVVSNLDSYVEEYAGIPEARDLLYIITDVVLSMHEDGLDNDAIKSALSFSIIDGEVVASIVNPKVRLLKSPCEVVNNDG
mgnify:CR=1 FL=1